MSPIVSLLFAVLIPSGESILYNQTVSNDDVASAAMASPSNWTTNSSGRNLGYPPVPFFFPIGPMFEQYMDILGYGRVPPHVEPAVMSHPTHQEPAKLQQLAQEGNAVNASVNVPISATPAVGTDAPHKISKRSSGQEPRRPPTQLPSLLQLPNLMNNGSGLNPNFRPNWRPSSLLQGISGGNVTAAGSNIDTKKKDKEKDKGCGKK